MIDSQDTRVILRALAAAARAFADHLEGELSAGEDRVPAASGMREVLRLLAALNDGQARGATDEDMREIARRAGMDPRGMAGYYRAKLLEMRPDGTRWLSKLGRARLAALSRVVVLDPPD
jgi:hypothetical protein